MMKSVKRMVASVMALTLTVGVASTALGEERDILGSVAADMHAIDQAERESEELDVDELVAADKAESDKAADAASKPLELRKSKPLALAEERPTNGWWWKLLVSGAIVIGAMFALKKRGALGGPKKTAVLDVLTRKSVGVRSEICIVCVDGHRLLLGITPHSIQRLAALPDPDDEMTIAETENVAPEAGPPVVEPGFASVLKGTYSRLAQLAEEHRVGKSATMSVSELVDVPPPESSTPRVIVRDSPKSKPRRIDVTELTDLAGAQAQSLRSLRRKAS